MNEAPAIEIKASLNSDSVVDLERQLFSSGWRRGRAPPTVFTNEQIPSWIVIFLVFLANDTNAAPLCCPKGTQNWMHGIVRPQITMREEAGTMTITCSSPFLPIALRQLLVECDDCIDVFKVPLWTHSFYAASVCLTFVLEIVAPFIVILLLVGR